jgi:hypothetical protein
MWGVVRAGLKDDFSFSANSRIGIYRARRHSVASSPNSRMTLGCTWAQFSIQANIADPDVLKAILVEKAREAAKCYRHQSLIASTVVAGSAFTLGSSPLSQS